jgi:hypothetical protein
MPLEHPTSFTPNFEEYFAANQRAVEALATAEQARTMAAGDLPGGLFLRYVIQANDSPNPYPNIVRHGNERPLSMPHDLIGLTLFAGVNDRAIQLMPPSINVKNEILVFPSLPTPDKRKKLTRQFPEVFAVGLGSAALARASWVTKEKAYEELSDSPDNVLDPRIAHQLSVADIRMRDN